MGFWVCLQILSKTSLILRSIQPDITTNVRTSSCEVPVLLSGFNVTVNFRSHFRKILECQFHGNPSNGSPLVPSERIDRQTDMTKLTVACRNFANAPEEQTAIFLLLSRVFCLIFRWRFDPITGHGLSVTGLRDYSVGRNPLEQ